MSHPLLRVVCLYAAGVLLGYSDARPGWVVGLLVAVLIFSAIFRRIRSLVWPALFIFAGWLNLTLHTQVWSADDLRNLVTEDAVLADIRGTLLETPRVSEYTRDEETLFRTTVEVRVRQIRFDRGEWIPATGIVLATVPDVLDETFHQGQQVEVSGVIGTADGPKAKGLFDYATYLERKGIYFQFWASSKSDWRIPDGTSKDPPFTDRFVNWARTTLACGLPPDDPATGLLQAMTLGWRTALTDEIEKPFMESGTMHIFAISGLHIALIAGILLAVLRALWIPRGICGMFLIPLLWFYTAATGWQSSALRATVMMTIILGGWALRRPSNLLNSLCAAALLILFFDPRQLLQASFQFSFAVVLALSLLLPPLQTVLTRSLQPDPLLPVGLIPKWKRWLGVPLRWVLLLIATSIAAWLGSMPLTAKYFHLFNPGALLANVLLVPCATAALASALASLVTGAWWSWGSEVFNHGAWFWMHCMMSISRGVSRLPAAFYYVAAPSPAILVVYYGTLLILAFDWINRNRIKWLLGGSVVLVASLLTWQIRTNQAAANLTVLPLNGGLAVCYKPEGAFHPMLVDCGNSDTFESTLEPFLHANGQSRIHALLVTHGDVRQMGAACQVMEEFKPRAVGISDVRFRSSVYRAFIKTIATNDTAVVRLEAGDEYQGWTVLYPPHSLQAGRADEGVLVLQGEICGVRVLLLSDLDRAGQRRLLDLTGPAALKSEIVVTGLPEEGEPLIQDLLQVVQPQLIVVGDDEFPPSRCGTTTLYERLKASGVTVLSTREDGAITLIFSKAGWKAVNARSWKLTESGESSPRSGN